MRPKCYGALYTSLKVSCWIAIFFNLMKEWSPAFHFWFGLLSWRTSAQADLIFKVECWEPLEVQMSFKLIKFGTNT
ncbi:hypothetical protein B0H19DRAFT_1133557 [Mycena capillaripes]|nr:hypothetical protein B0H19DRAFT_1133557 [Mycena capillaripes]